MTTDDLTTNPGYMKRYYQHVQAIPDTPTRMNDALICVESELRQQHGLRRYSTLNSLRAATSRKRDRGCRLRPVK